MGQFAAELISLPLMNIRLDQFKIKQLGVNLEEKKKKKTSADQQLKSADSLKFKVLWAVVFFSIACQKSVNIS